VTAVIPAIALVSADARTRGELARYLEEAGFAVTELAQPPRARAATALVWLTERELHPRVAETVVRAWLSAGSEARRAVVVTWRPAALRALLDEYEGRLFVLPPPVFGWQVVDALRAAAPGSREDA